VLHTSHEYRTGAAAAIAPTIVGVDAFAEESNERRRRLAAERSLDQVLADSFPASDPPSWNTGIVRPGPRSGIERPHAERFEAIADTTARAVASDVLDVSRPSSGDPTFLQALMSLAGAAGIALLVPFAMLLVGLPVVLAVRGVLEVIDWIVGVALQ
jgi:hypothetical protein